MQLGGLIQLTGITASPEALVRRLQTGKPLVLSDVFLCLENGVIREKRIAVGRKKNQFEFIEE